MLYKISHPNINIQPESRISVFILPKLLDAVSEILTSSVKIFPSPHFYDPIYQCAFDISYGTNISFCNIVKGPKQRN